MSPIVRYVVTREPGPAFRLASMTACLILWLLSECSAASGFSPIYSMELSDVPRPRFTIFHQAWGRDLIPLLSPSDVLDEAMLFIPTWASRDASVATLKTLPFLAAVTYSHAAALQFSLSQFLFPPEPLDLITLLSLPLELASDGRLMRQFTVAQMYGTVLLDPTDHQALHYALYAGALTAESSDHLLIGARIRYTFERGEVTMGIDSLYSQYNGGTDSLAPFLTARTARLPGGDSQIVELLLHIEQDKRALRNNNLQGLPIGDAAALAVFIKPVVRLNQHWTAFYRFDHLSFGPGLPKLTEHALGVRFFPRDNVLLRAEFLMSHLSQESLNAEGFRLSGTIRF